MDGDRAPQRPGIRYGRRGGPAFEHQAGDPLRICQPGSDPHKSRRPSHQTLFARGRRALAPRAWSFLYLVRLKWATWGNSEAPDSRGTIESKERPRSNAAAGRDRDAIG